MSQASARSHDQGSHRCGPTPSRCRRRSRTRGAASDGSWDCSICTLINSADSGRCTACGSDTYQASTQHWSTECIDQPVCDQGKYYYTTDPKTDRGSCTTCPPNKYRTLTKHRYSSCEEQRTCGQGQYYTDSKTKEGTCTACGSNTYQDVSSHRYKCKAQPTCGSGERMSDDSTSAERVCSKSQITKMENQSNIVWHLYPFYIKMQCWLMDGLLYSMFWDLLMA